MDPGVDRCQRETRGGSASSRRRLWERGFHFIDGERIPPSRFFGFDYHDKSIEAARESARYNGVADRVTFNVSRAKDFPGKDYDLVALFDCLHDMGDRSGRCTGPAVFGQKWHLDDRRAFCQ
jgi:hypothetical protein